MASLAKKLRDARRFEAKADDQPDGITFLLRRPTDLEMMDLRGAGSAERFFRFLAGWKNVKESDIVAGGDPHAVEFEPELAREWLADRQELFATITSGLLSAYNKHTSELEEKLKNSTAGSTPSAIAASQ